MCPAWGSNLPPFGVRDDLQLTARAWASHFFFLRKEKEDGSCALVIVVPAVEDAVGK